MRTSLSAACSVGAPPRFRGVDESNRRESAPLAGGANAPEVGIFSATAETGKRGPPKPERTTPGGRRAGPDPEPNDPFACKLRERP